MAFRKKAKYILEEKPDLIIVSESENLEKLIFEKEIEQPNGGFWVGKNPHKGLGVYSYSDFTISASLVHNQDFKYVVPLAIKNKEIEFTLLAIWCQKPETSANYCINIWNAINYYKNILKEEKVIIAGDFNSNKFWDKPKKIGNHSDIVEKLEEHKIESNYHLFFNEEQGQEQTDTFFLYKNIGKPYHIDYCFTSEFFTKRLKKVTVGKFEKWIKYSDHLPLICEYDI